MKTEARVSGVSQTSPFRLPGVRLCAPPQREHRSQTIDHVDLARHNKASKRHEQSSAELQFWWYFSVTAWSNNKLV